MVVFWSVWLAVGIALIAGFLCKVPALLINKIISSATGSCDYGILTANLQDGASVLCEPSDSSSRYLARYQIYQRNSDKKYFIGEWKYPVDSAEYSIFCYTQSGALADVIRVAEPADKKRYTAVCELPGSTDYVVLRVRRVNGEKLRKKPANKALYAWLAAMFLCCAAAVSAALCLVYAWMTRVWPENFNFGLGNIALSSAIVFAASAAIYAFIVIWLFFGGRVKRQKQTKKAVPTKKRAAFSKIGYVFSAASCKIRNMFQGFLWAFPLRKSTLRRRGAKPDDRAVKRLKNDEGKR